MYSEKLVIAVKANDKILREFGDTVYVPFGTEYSLLIKNLNSLRVIINITIDGEDVCAGGLVLNPHQSVDLERFIKDGNLNSGNRFKFIERTSSVENYRGIKLEDGLIRVSFKFEDTSKYFANTPNWQNMTSTTVSSQTFPKVKSGSILRSGGVLNNTTSSELPTATYQSLSNVGITVPGSVSNQKFSAAGYFPTQLTEHVMVIKLLGKSEKGNEVKNPITVKSSITCKTCGRVNKATSKFCSECGTSLTII